MLTFAEDTREYSPDESLIVTRRNDRSELFTVDSGDNFLEEVTDGEMTTTLRENLLYVVAFGGDLRSGLTLNLVVITIEDDRRHRLRAT